MKRWISLGEFAAGSAIVIGHNVFHVVPNEVPILVVLAIVSFRLRDGRWGIIGMSRPASWRRTVLLAAAATAVRIGIGFVDDAITAHFWPPAAAPSDSESIQGHPLIALQWLAIIWTFAAFGEEIAYRGYLLNRAAEAGRNTRTAYWLSVIAVALLFGFGHDYKGPAGVLDSGMAGLILGAAYVLSGRNLWVCILAHGFIDTTFVIAEYVSGGH